MSADPNMVDAPERSADERAAARDLYGFTKDVLATADGQLRYQKHCAAMAGAAQQLQRLRLADGAALPFHAQEITR